MAKKLSLDEFTIGLAGMKKYGERGSNRSTIEKMQKFISRAIDIELTENEKKYLIGYYIGGNKMHELAAENNVSVANVSKTIRRALNKLRARSVYIDLI